ncbi:uncharacterized protein ARB_07499 [Trichophyton benhamiae CBS 112371]|uniref:Uncharacterized protein n=1 Tax=Arthroderma benhamiae (strain ATCC MYA-4681 / CBS 112371) TaxID=663331 RepID=D4ATD5_ARTBC|nr:uncharacterized protein ARB_07499 [Trichophyton benhamiae CBS 112371]EFE33554.1 hypothetical protein ARB_07499 [Trichophyton benhamiae CBS 112371]
MPCVGVYMEIELAKKKYREPEALPSRPFNLKPTAGSERLRNISSAPCCPSQQHSNEEQRISLWKTKILLANCPYFC